MEAIFPPLSSPLLLGDARERELQHWDRLEERRGGSQLDWLTFRELKTVWLEQLTWQVFPLETPQQGVGLVYLACQFSLRHTKYITFVLLCLTQTNKPSLRLSISPKKGYVVKFSTVATEWLWGPQVPREWFWVRRSRGIYEGSSQISRVSTCPFWNFFCIVEVPGSITFCSGHPIPCKINVRMY